MIPVFIVEPPPVNRDDPFLTLVEVTPVNRDDPFVPNDYATGLRYTSIF